MKKQCQDFYPGPYSGQAIDRRFTSMLTDLQPPSEYEIQLHSGVLDQLIHMPSNDFYLKDPFTEKRSFMGRPTLYFDPSCSRPISDAIDVLNNLKE